MFFHFKVVWENRYMQSNGSTSLITVDGTDCPIAEPSPFDPKWYSHKFKCAGLRYEVGVCIQTGWIVWVNGPYECGRFPDLKIARYLLHGYMGNGEMYVANGRYRDGCQYGDTPTGFNTLAQRMKKVTRSRHEIINARFKSFKVLSTKFRSEPTKHWMAFHSIANVVQIEITGTNPPFQVLYNDQGCTIGT